MRTVIFSALSLFAVSCGMPTGPTTVCGERVGVIATADFVDRCVLTLTSPSIHASRATLLEYAGKQTEPDTAKCLVDEIATGTLAKDNDKPRY